MPRGWGSAHAVETRLFCARLIAPSRSVRAPPPVAQVDWDDRNTCILFGDGAGAVVVQRAQSGAPPGLLGFEMRSDGSGRTDLNLGYQGEARPLSARAGTVTKGAYGSIAMNGKEVRTRPSPRCARGTGQWQAAAALCDHWRSSV